MATVVADMSVSLDGFVADPSDGVQRSWWPSQLDTRQRLEQYRDKLRAHLGAVSSEPDATKASAPDGPGRTGQALCGSSGIMAAGGSPHRALSGLRAAVGSS